MPQSRSMESVSPVQGCDMPDPPPLASRVREVADSSTLVMSARAKQLQADGVDVVNLTAGEPDLPTPERIIEAALAFVRLGQIKYTPTLGLPELRRAVAQRYNAAYGLDLSPGRTIIGCGGKHVLYMALQALIEPGDEVIIPSPYWVSYPEMVRLASGRPVFLPTADTGFRPDLARLERAITPRTRMLILNSPSNPTGMRLPAAELAELVDLALRHNLWIVSDEIYDQLCYGGEPVTSPLALGEAAESRTIVCNSFSKSYSMTGWRIGYAIGPVQVIEAMGRVQAHETSNPCTISQVAAIEALHGSQAMVAALRDRFDARRRVMLEGLAAIPDWPCVEPQGAFYTFPRIDGLFGRRSPGGRTLGGSLDLAMALMEEARVATVPGVAFGDDRYLRLSYATSRAEIARGMERVQAWVAGVG